MKTSFLPLLALALPTINARFVENHETDQVVLNAEQSDETFLIELAPGETQWVTEEQKWALRRVRCLETSDCCASLTMLERAELHGHNNDPKFGLDPCIHGITQED